MSNNHDKQPQEQPFLLLDGRPATEQERRRIFSAGKQQAKPRKDDDRATKPLHNRGFDLMR